MTERISELLSLLRDEDNCNVLDCIDEAADLIEAFAVKLEQTENKLSELLYYVTGGRFSKTEYSTDDMRRFVDDYNQCVCNECDELKDAKRECAAAIADMKDIADNYVVCMHCKKRQDESGACDRWHDQNGCWEWRGVKEG